MRPDIRVLAVQRRVKTATVARNAIRRLREPLAVARVRSMSNIAAQVRDRGGCPWRDGTRDQRACTAAWAELLGTTVETLWPDTASDEVRP